MLEINLFDSNFIGQDCSVALQTPRLMRYVRDQLDWPGITVFTDAWMYHPVVDDVQSRFKIGWLHEARSLHPENYERIGDVSHKFDAVMTHDAALLASGHPFIKTIRGGSWVALDQWGMYPKSKNVSMILSEKTQLNGHKLRHAIARAGLPIDLFGPQHTPIGYNKALAYKDYRFAVVVEACREDNFFSEHLLDALAYSCVPIYWGCPNIGAWFEPGMWQFNTLSYLVNSGIDALNDDSYRPMRPWVETWQRQARAYAITEDWQVQHCLRPFVEAL
jgi:hypothetical protein